MNLSRRLRNILGGVALSGALLFAAAPATAHASVFVSVGIAPPAIPVYTQPPIPGDGYIWTPGYWAWTGDGYEWVDGAWVLPPYVGALWTPGYWGFYGGHYRFYRGYWGPHIGFYGGVNYGFGYTGVGYEGGYWRGGVFSYNRAVNNFGSVHVTNVYNRTVVVNNVNRVSYNGGRGGISMQPSASERAAFNERHMEATRNQMEHQQAMQNNRGQLASVNHGRPQTMAMSRVNDRPVSPQARQVNQQQRIAAGVRSGEMGPRETQHVEHQEAQIHQQVRNDRQANGGHLDQQQRQQVNREQNHVSREIHNARHN